MGGEEDGWRTYGGIALEFKDFAVDDTFPGGDGKRAAFDLSGGERGRRCDGYSDKEGHGGHEAGEEGSLHVDRGLM